ncbi:maleylpyruvate isomerase family mycothiol-dependent enzyme [Streptomyces sp. B6B3]|uniref:maleylpyruvate isomerase family mycothiol-dependent enzyme n=1 Tax=Streptomyces sp. B6B3 TaxID=3153570 RepID=UPI00325CB758
METGDFLARLADEGEALIGAALRAGPGAAVPSCPDWRVRDLVSHQGNVHRWAATFVGERRREPLPMPVGRVPDGELADWFRDGHRSLLAVLREASEDLVCWSFLPGSPTSRHFWARRQAHETTVHRVDAELAAGSPVSAVPAELAADGVAELLTGFHGRPRSRVRSARPRTLGIRATDRPEAHWRVVISDEPPRAERAGADTPVECEISGPAEALYLALWNRRRFADGLAVRGDAALAELWRTTSGV